MVPFIFYCSLPPPPLPRAVFTPLPVPASQLLGNIFLIECLKRKCGYEKGGEKIKKKNKNPLGKIISLLLPAKIKLELGNKKKKIAQYKRQ